MQRTDFLIYAYVQMYATTWFDHSLSKLFMQKYD